MINGPKKIIMDHTVNSDCPVARAGSPGKLVHEEGAGGAGGTTVE